MKIRDRIKELRRVKAEQPNRRCYAIEISPAYCDVACQRWAKLTGKTPVREDGSEFEVSV